jgi:putative phosphoesterase
MRLAVIADVHSNLHALRAVMARIDALGADMTVCAGDIVGYGAQPNQCTYQMRELASAAVAGNHDLSALTRDTTLMNRYAAEAAIWTADKLEKGARQYLSSLRTTAKLQMEGRSMGLFHGSPRDVAEYIYEDAAGDGLVREAGCDIVILGHTHIPFIKRTASGLIVNPGSVGQPRDGNPDASFAVLDPANLSAQVVRVEYDVEAAAESIMSERLPAFLAERLLRGF